MMQYEMDRETAFVVVSAVTFATPGSASGGSGMESKDEVATLQDSMTAEWKSVLTVLETYRLPWQTSRTRPALLRWPML